MSFQESRRFCLKVLSILSVCLASAADATDTDVYLSRSGGIAPNVVFSMDTSGSMVDNSLNVPDDYSPGINYNGVFQPGGAYFSVDGRIPNSTDGLSATTIANVSHCNFAAGKISTDGFVAVRAAVAFENSATAVHYAKQVWFPANRVHFELFSDGASRVECQDDAGNHGPAAGGSDMYASRETGQLYTSNFAEEIDWSKYPYVVIYSGNYLNYKLNPGSYVMRTRAFLQQRVVRDAIKRTPEIFAGLVVFNDKLIPGGSWDNHEDYIYYGAVKSAVKDNSIRSNQSLLLQAVDIDVADYNNATPLGAALLEILHYYHGKAPLLAPPGETDQAAMDGEHYKSPIQSACQKNYVLFVTDGAPFGDLEAEKYFRYQKMDYPKYEEILDRQVCNGDNCLDDVAEYLAIADAYGDANDNLYDLDGDGAPDAQTVKVYPIGMEIEQTLLQETAGAAGTESYYATSAVEFENAIVDILATIKAKQGASMVTASSSIDAYSKVSNRNFLYFGMFEPTSNFQWNGNLKKYRIAYKNSGDADPYNDVAYVTDRDSGDREIATDTGQLIPEAHSYWSSFADGNNAMAGGVVDRLKHKSNRNMSGINNWNTDQQRVFTTANEISLSNQFFSNNMGAMDRSDAERAAIVNYALGKDVRDEDGDDNTTEQRGHLGAIVRSGPVTVQYGNEDGDPAVVVFAVTTDGVLHAFNDENGDELWSLMLNDAYSKLVEQYDNHGSFAPWWGMDGGITPHVIDENANGIIEEGDKVYLLINTGLGLKKWLVVDVSTASTGTGDVAIMARSEPPIDYSVNPPIANLDWSEFGMATARMIPITYRLAGDADGKKRSAFLYANGYDPVAEFSYGEHSVGRGLTLHESDEAELSKFGDVLWKATRSTGGYPSMEYGFATTPTTVDLNGDGFVDLIYVIDLNAQLWRFHRNSDATVVSDLFSGGIMAKLGSDASGHRRRAYKRVDAAVVSAGGGAFVLLAIGTGDRMNPMSDSETDRLHIILDRSALSGETPDTIITAADLYNASNNILGQGTDAAKLTAADSLNAATGWYIDLPAGQKAISAPLISSGVVNFPVYRPNTATVAQCENTGVGDGLLYRMNVLTAEPVEKLSGGSGGELTKEDRYTVLHAGGIPGDAVSHTSSTGVKTIFTNLQGFVAKPGGGEAGFFGGAAGYWFEAN